MSMIGIIEEPSRQGRAPQLVAVDALPEYPIARAVRLDSNAFTKWHHHRWLSSTLHLLASYEVQGMARALFDIAQVQSPVGSLPDDNLMLARLLRLDLGIWIEIRARAMSPLHNWALCLSEGERRLMHPVVLEQVRDAIDRREQYVLSREEKAEYQRLKRLCEALADLGCAASVIEDGILMGRMNDWLKAACRGKRTRRSYEQALMHAIRSGWMPVAA